jgi:hypothetical protein
MTATTLNRVETPLLSQDRPTDEDIFASCKDDPDANPTPLGAKREWQSYVHVGLLCDRLGLTPEAFANRYKIPAEIVRDWEQQRSRPDRTAVAYLRAISLEPDIIAEIVNRQPKRPDAD